MRKIKLSTNKEIVSFIKEGKIRKIHEIDRNEISPNLIYSLLSQDIKHYTKLQPYIDKDFYFRLIYMNDRGMCIHEIFNKIINKYEFSDQLLACLIELYKQEPKLKGDLYYLYRTNCNQDNRKYNYVERPTEGEYLFLDYRIGDEFDTDDSPYSIQILALSHTLSKSKKCPYIVLKHIEQYYESLIGKFFTSETISKKQKKLVKHPNYSIAKDLLNKMDNLK